MSLTFTFPPMNNQATIPITTANSNILVTLTSPSTITTTAISAAPGRVSINPAPAISGTGTGPDANFETSLNAMENAIFKLGSTLENFISTNNRSGNPRGENDREYLTDFSVNIPNLKLMSTLMMRVIVAHLLKRNPAGML